MMRNIPCTPTVLACLALLQLPGIAVAAEPDLATLWQLVQAQQDELTALRQELAETRRQLQLTNSQNEELAESVEAVAAYVESAPSTSASWASRTTLGGYGEMLYNDQTASSSSRELDIQRFVLFVNHEFTDRLRFVSELEIEHSLIAGDDDTPGAVELEQAYLQWDYARDHNVLAGMYLPPIGILNETHEPNTFYGVERNTVESRIIPTTYRVNGVKFAGRLTDGWSYDLGLHEGLFFPSGNGGDLSIRSARQDGARAEMDSPAVTGRIRYTGVPGLELALSLQYQPDLTQDGSIRTNIGRTGVVVPGGLLTDVDGILSEAHVALQRGNWGFRALYARWDIDQKIESALNSNLSLNGLGRDRQYGYYVEPSYRFNERVGVFARFEEVDERAGSRRGAAADSATRRTLVGLNYWLNPNAVLKLDYQFESDELERDLDGFNLGVGWQF